MTTEPKGTELAEASRQQNQVSLGQLTFANPAGMVAQAKVVATTLKSIITDLKLSKIISGGEHVFVEGWTTLGAMIGVLPRTVSVEELTIIYEGGEWTVFEATVELVRTSDGFVVGRGIAECGAPDEVSKEGKPIWANRARQAKKSMAITRATGKAYRLSYSWIIKMAGYESAPAEEMPGTINGSFVEKKKPPKKKKAPAKKKAAVNTKKGEIKLELPTHAKDWQPITDFVVAHPDVTGQDMNQMRKDNNDDALLVYEYLKENYA